MLGHTNAPPRVVLLVSGTDVEGGSVGIIVVLGSDVELGSVGIIVV